MNIISFDIEEWYIEKKYWGGRRERYDLFDKYLHLILDELDQHNIQATFFCLGKIATDFTHVIREIKARNHEIGCHSNEHDWLTKLSPNELIKDTKDAIKALEDASGDRVLSYRAPAFSIGNNNKWALEVLAECGIERDASIFPALRDFGGFSSFESDTPSLISYNGISLKEFPISTAKLLSKKFVYSGGGYFRFFPYCYIKDQIKCRDYTMCYFHIGDLIHDKNRLLSKQEYEQYFRENGSLLNRSKRYIKSSLGKKYAFIKLQHLLNDFEFCGIDQADKLINWNNLNKIEL